MGLDPERFGFAVLFGMVGLLLGPVLFTFARTAYHADPWLATASIAGSLIAAVLAYGVVE